MGIADSSSEITFKFRLENKCQYKWRCGETGNIHEYSQETESQHDVDAEDVAADSVTTDEAYYKNYSVEIVIWYLKNIWEP